VPISAGAGSWSNCDRFHYANIRNDRLSALFDELIRRPVAVIVTNQIAAIAAKAATAMVPVFAIGGAPFRTA
jgi:hypothetical protein